jgi:hypothetical protein
MRVIVIVGLGPRGVSVLERIGANLPAVLPETGDVVEIHVVDPYPPGAGRIWRLDQSPLLRMNSLAMDTTLFTDPSVTCHGPVRQGPSMAEWAVSAATDDLADAALVDEAKHLAPMHFATRRLGGEYMRWCFEQAVALIGERARVVVHQATATALDDLDDGRLRVHLDDGTAPLDADAVVLTLGHLDAVPAGEQAEIVAHAAAHDLVYLPPEHASDADLERFAPGQDVIVRGFGLDFVDKVVLLTEGRGGRFTTRSDGSYHYVPSGREPIIHVGSRRGVPYRSKLDYELLGPRPPHPRFCSVDAAAALVEAHEELSFREHAWPLIAKEVGWGYYHQLFHAHPDRVRLTWEAFDAQMAELGWHSEGMRTLVQRAVPERADRLDFEALDRPLAGRWFDDDDALQRWVRDHIEADVVRRTDDRYSADLGAFFAFLAVFPAIAVVLSAPNLSARSRVEDFDQWWFGFFSYYASGPPPRRLREMVALADAGLLTFVGAEMRLAWDGHGFHASSASSPRVVHARALIDARIPDPTVEGSGSLILRHAAAGGHVVEHVLVDPDGTPFPVGQIRVAPRDQRAVRRAGDGHPALFAVGPHSTSRAPVFARRGTNSVALRHNDIVARGALERIAAAQA